MRARSVLPSERTAWRRCASLLGDVMGPVGPRHFLPTLNRVRERPEIARP